MSYREIMLMGKDDLNGNLRVCSELIDLADAIGEFIQYWGFKKVHGQVWTIIYLSSEPIESSQIAKVLGLSKGLISLAIKDLLTYKVIEQSGKGKKRTLYFKSSANLGKVIADVLANRELKIIETVKTKLVRVESHAENGTDLNLDNLLQLKSMVCDADDFLQLLVRTQLELPWENECPE